jgi:sulfatase modifying factor 1
MLFENISGRNDAKDTTRKKAETVEAGDSSDAPLFSLIPGMTESDRPSLVRQAESTSSVGGTDRQRVLARSSVTRVPVDLQQVWREHSDRLQSLGVRPDENTPLAIRNEIDGGIALWIPAGPFTMGSNRGKLNERPIHRVHVDGYYMDLCPITNLQFQTFLEATSYANSTVPPSLDQPDHPAVNISWDDAQAYCRWADKRLPSEAEWEKAAAGLSGGIYSWGDQFDAGKASVLGNGFRGSAPVGNLPDATSPFGLLDMSGNVWEWVGDWYGERYYGSSPSANPHGPQDGSERVLRGGARVCHANYLRCSYREHQIPQHLSRFIGARCAQ